MTATFITVREIVRTIIRKVINVPTSLNEITKISINEVSS